MLSLLRILEPWTGFAALFYATTCGLVPQSAKYNPAIPLQAMESQNNAMSVYPQASAGASWGAALRARRGANTSFTRLIIVGTTSRVKTVELTSPPTTTIPRLR